MVSNAKDRCKAAAIPVLALILGYVLWSRFTDADADGAGPAAMLTTAAQNFMQTRRETAEALEELNRMSSVNLDTALEHDPFAVLAPLSPAPADVVDADDVEEDAPADEMSAEDEEEVRQQERDQQLASLRSLEVSAVLTSGQHPSALLGSRVIRVGDTLPGGATVVAIDRDGVVVRLPEEAP